jgi:hypothetical protein
MFIKDAWLVQGKNIDHTSVFIVKIAEMVLEIWFTRYSGLA